MFNWRCDRCIACSHVRARRLFSGREEVETAHQTSITTTRSSTELNRIMTDWLPSLARHIVKRSALRLPADARIRYYEEWLADLEQYPGKLSKLIRAFGHAHSSVKLQWQRGVYAKTNSSSSQAARNLEIIMVLDQFIEMLRSRGVLESKLAGLRAARSLVNVDVGSLSDEEFWELIRHFEHKARRGQQIRGTRRPRSFDVLYGEHLSAVSRPPATPASRPPGPRSRCRPT